MRAVQDLAALHGEYSLHLDHAPPSSHPHGTAAEQEETIGRVRSEVPTRRGRLNGLMSAVSAMSGSSLTADELKILRTVAMDIDRILLRNQGR